MAKLQEQFPPPDEAVGGAVELRWLTDGIDNQVVELQYRSSSIAAPLSVALFVLIPTSIFALVPAFTGELDLVRGIILGGLVVLIVMLARYANSSLGWLTDHRDQLRWLLERRQAYLAEIRRLDELEAARSRAEERALLADLINAAQRRP